MSKSRVSVVIDGRSYVLVTEDDEAYVNGVAKEVSEHLLRAASSSLALDERDCAILVALDFCDDCKKQQQRNRELVKKADVILRSNNELSHKVADYKNRLTDAINENTHLSQRIRALEDQLRVLNRENEKLRKLEQPKKPDAEKKFEKTVRDKKAEKAMGYVPMTQGTLFDLGDDHADK